MKRFLWLGIAVGIFFVGGLFFAADSAEACASHPCILFPQSEISTIQARISGGVPQTAWNALRTTCVGPSGPATPNMLYQECALKCVIQGQSCSDAKAAFMVEIGAAVPVVGGLPSLSYLNGLKIPRMVLTFDWLKAAGQITPQEEPAIIRKFQELAEGIKNYDFSPTVDPNPSVPGNTIAGYPIAVSNGTFSLSSAAGLIGLVLKNNPYINAPGALYYTTPTAIETLITENRNRVVNGYLATYSIDGVYPEGFRYIDYSPDSGSVYFLKALALNGYGNEVQMAGNLLRHAGAWIGYVGTGGKFPFYAETQPADGNGQRLPFDLYWVVRVLGTSATPLAQDLARLGRDRLNEFYNQLLSTASLNNGNNLFYGFYNGNSAHIGPILWYPEQLPSGIDQTALRPTKFFRDNADSGAINTQVATPGRGGELVVTNRLAASAGTGGDWFVKLLHSTKQRWVNHSGPHDGQIIASMKDASGYQRFLEGPGYIQVSGYVGANSQTDYSTAFRVGDAPISGSHYTYRPFDGTTKASLLGWGEQTYYRATHNYAWQLNEGSRTLAYINDPNHPYAIVFDYLNDGSFTTAPTFQETWISEVQGSWAGTNRTLSFNGVGTVGSGKSFVMNYHYPTSGLNVTTPGVTQLATNHNGHRNTVQQTTSAANPNAKFFLTMDFRFSGSSVATDNVFSVSAMTGGYGVERVWSDGTRDAIFVRNPDVAMMSHTGTPTLAATDARFVWVKRDASGQILRYIVGEGNDVNVGGTQLIDVLTPGIRVNASMGRGFELSQVDPFTSAAVPLPEVAAYLPSGALLNPSGVQEVRWNEGPLTSSQYLVVANQILVNTTIPGGGCSVQNLQWSAPLSVSGGAIANVQGTTSGCGNGTQVQIEIREDDGAQNPLQQTMFPIFTVAVSNNQFTKQVHAVWEPLDGPTGVVEYRARASTPNTPTSVSSSNVLSVAKSPHTLITPVNMYAGGAGSVTVATTDASPRLVYLFATSITPSTDPTILNDGNNLIPSYWPPEGLGTTWIQVGSGITVSGTPYTLSLSIPTNAPQRYYVIALVADPAHPTGALVVPFRPAMITVVGGTGLVSTIFSKPSVVLLLILAVVLYVIFLEIRRKGRE